MAVVWSWWNSIWRPLASVRAGAEAPGSIGELFDLGIANAGGMACPKSRNGVNNVDSCGLKRDGLFTSGLSVSFSSYHCQGSSNGLKKSGVPEVRSRKMNPALLVCEVSPCTPKMNLQLLELSNKRATGNIAIRK
jgi:hypothetical protein